MSQKSVDRSDLESEVSCFAIAATAKQVALYRVCRHEVVQLAYAEQLGLPLADKEVYGDLHLSKRPKLDTVEDFIHQQIRRFDREYALEARSVAVFGPKVWRRLVLPALLQCRAIIVQQSELPASDQLLKRQLLGIHELRN